MPERRLDEDDDNWVFANRGRVGGRRPTRVPKEKKPRPDPPPERPPGADHDKWDESRDDIRKVYERLGLTPPWDKPESEPEPEESPDAWRDDWREMRVQTPRNRR